MNMQKKAKTRMAGYLCLISLISVLVCNPTAAGKRLTLNFNPDWKFIRSDPNGAQAPDFDDNTWTTVSAPHTYNDVDTFDDWSVAGHHGESSQWQGRTWYRKTFTAPTVWQDQKVYVEFEAVRQVAEVYLNGRLLGIHKSGFSPFGFELTQYLKFDQPNVLAVMCDNRFQWDQMQQELERIRRESTSQTGANPTGTKDRGPSSSIRALTESFNRDIPDDLDDLEAYQIPWNNPHWHPAHGGLYRNVKLHVVDPLHITLPLYSFLQTTGPYVYATGISDESALIHVEIPIENGRLTDENVEVTVKVIDRDGESVLTLDRMDHINAGATSLLEVSGVLKNPQLWEPDYPYLYRVVLTLKVGGKAIDTVELPHGIRTVKWTIDQGFFINDHHLKLHGWGQKSTDEWPGIGNAQPDWMHYFTMNLMKEAGGNFVRWGHTAGGPAHIVAADRLGIITDQPGVDGEGDTRAAAWELRSNTFRDIIIYFRNNPSILIWEGGNQKVSREHAAELHGHVEKYDPHGGRVYTHRRPDRVVAEFMDVQIGTEGGSDIGMSTMPIFEGEYDREEAPRRVWDDATPRHVGGDPLTSIVYGYVEGSGSYRLTSEEFAVNQVRQYMDKLSPVNHSGGANWIFSDSTSGGRVPSEVARVSGEIDGVRLPKEAYWVCRTIFRNEPLVHIIGHWNYPTGINKTVYVASNCDMVELLVNGKSLGRIGPTEHEGKSLQYLFTFPEVTYVPGRISAVGYKDGKVAAEQVKKTVGEPVALKMTPITGPAGLMADDSDYLLIDVEAVDANGLRCPTFEQRVNFEIDGPGTWRGGYNSGRIKSINHSYLNLECGINRVAVRAGRIPGTITVIALCEGLTSGHLTVASQPVVMEHGYTTTIPVIPEVKLVHKPIVGAVGIMLSPDQGIGYTNNDQNGGFVTAFPY